MVCEWFPEPPQDYVDRLSAPSQVVAEDDEGSDDESIGHGPAGYELLSQSLNGLSSDEESSEDEAAAACEPSNLTDLHQQSADLQARTQRELEEVASLYSATSSRPDINVNCDEVRAAMAGFTLPPSAIPSWAANIPESQWTSTLTQQIRRIQNNTTENS